jgi:hypothetical protein
VKRCPRRPEIFANGGSRRLIVKSLHREPLNRLYDLTIQRFNGLRVGLRLAQTRDAVAGLPLAAFLEKFGALETLEDIALAAKGGRRAQTAML